MAKGSLRVNGIIVDTDGEIKASTGDSIVIREDDGSAVITVDTSGNVGINTTAPGAQFDIRGPAGTGSASASVLRMSTAETSVVDADQLGRIEFIAPLEAGGTDAILVGASIHAEADATFAADNNSTELVFSTGASEAAAEKVRITSDGKVGIGVAVPGSLLSVGSISLNNSGDTPLGKVASTNPAILINNSSHVNSESQILFGYNSGTETYAPVAISYKNTSASSKGKGDLLFALRDSTSDAVPVERMRITSAGNTLIGGITSAETIVSATPKVQVEGVGYADSSLSLFNNSNDSNSAALYIGKSRGTALSSDTIVQDGDFIGGINFIAADGTDRASRVAAIYSAIDGTPGANDTPGELLFYTVADGANALTTAQMVIKANGSVGIGTTAPADNLHVIGTLRVNETTTLGHATNAGTAFEIRGDALASGSTDVDAFKAFKIAHNDGSEYGGQAQFSLGRWEEDGSNARSSLVISLGNGGINSSSNADVDVMTFRSDGKVGIGTTAPASTRLEVRANSGGTSASSSLVSISNGDDSSMSEGILNVKNAGNRGAKGHASGSPLVEFEFSDATAFIINKDGQVGIGTNSPDQQVEVRNSSSAYTCVIQVGANGVSGENREFGAIHFKNNHSNASGALGAIEAFRQDSDTNVAIRFNTHDSGSEVTRLIIGATGNVTPGGNNVGNLGASDLRWVTVYSTNALNTSDRNEKREIEENKLGLNFINALKTKSYKFKDNKLGGRTHYGLIAQDIENVLNKFNIKLDEYAPVVKDKIKDENENERFIYSLAYNELLAPIIKSVQELSTKNDALSAEIASLKNTG